jgi:hypothetical protein
MKNQNMNRKIERKNRKKTKDKKRKDKRQKRQKTKDKTQKRLKLKRREKIQKRQKRKKTKDKNKTKMTRTNPCEFHHPSSSYRAVECGEGLIRSARFGRLIQPGQEVSPSQQHRRLENEEP